MKQSIKNILILSLFFQASVVYGQQINIGDQCPDVTLSNIVNYKTTTAKISDFKGKLLIIDFWATWCNPCVGMIPKTDSLQKQFADQLQIFPVTNQDKNTVSKFYEKYNNVKHILPFSATADTAMWRLFKPNQFPHYVWIDQAGKVIAITGMEDVNAANIRKILNGTAIRLKQKRINYTVNLDKPYFSVGTPIIDSANVSRIDFVPNDSVLFHSVLTKYHGAGYNSGGHIGYNPTRISVFNESIRDLYKQCLGKFQYPFLFNNRVILETKDSALTHCALQGPQYLEWLRGHSYCYELVLPNAMGTNELAAIMAEDLNRYFRIALGIEGVLETRKTKCLVLVRTTKEDLLASKSTGKEDAVSNQFYYKDNGGYLINFMHAIMLDLQTINTPIVDGTGYTGKIDIELNCNTHNFNSVNKALEKYGLKFELQDYPVDYIVIRDVVKKPVTALK